MEERNRTPFFVIALALLLGLALPLWGCNQTQGSSQGAASTQEQTTKKDGGESESKTETAALDFHKPGNDYKLQQVVVLSRHNIRAPLSTTGSALDQATPHKWIDWTANASELTMRGGALETMMGSYVRKWLESEQLIPENYRPEDGAVRFYANGKQRIIATAQFFSSGMLPVANVNIETHAEYDKMDPVFSPSLTFMSDSYRDAALKEIGSMNGAKGIEDVVDYKDSENYK